jgi:DNA helicase-2/ATP-dependent DNA helicase PcrA
MWVMTFHAACARMLRVEAEKLGYTRQFTIYDQADARRLLKRCLDDLGVDPKRFTPGSVHNQISDAKNKLRAADDYRKLVGSYFEQTVADAYELYERELVRMNAMDFDDLLVRAVNVLELFPRSATATAAPSATSSSTSTRTPTTRSTAGCSS